MSTERIVLQVDRIPPATGTYVPPPSMPLPPPPDVTPGESGPTATPEGGAGYPPPPTPPVEPPADASANPPPTPGSSSAGGSGTPPGGPLTSGSPTTPGGAPTPGGPATQAPAGNAMAGNAVLLFTVTITAASTAIDTLVDTVSALDDSFQEMIRRGSDWNANIGMAAEMADLRTQMAEWRRANFLERELVDYSGARSELDVQIKELVTVVSKDILPLMSDSARNLADILYGLRSFYVKHSDWLPELRTVIESAMTLALTKIAGAKAGKVAEKIVDYLLSIRDELRDQREKEFDDADFAEFRKSMQTVLSPVLSRVNGDKEKLLAERPEFKPFFPD